MELRPGTLIANTYEILGPLGRGGMGELFKARNARTERRVALKLLRPDAKARADAIERFRREARAAGMINSDHVTQVLDIQEDPTHGIAIAFELLEGENLLDRLRRTGVMSMETVYPIIEQVLRGLCDAHAVGIIHRDLKPSNIFLEQRPDGTSRVKILDFGISKLPKTMAKTTLTEPGQALGSFMFMPPEQIQRAANVDQRADVYAIGTLVFQAMTGHLPHSARSMIELVQMKTSAEPRTMEQASGKPFPPQLQQWVSQCLRRNRDERFQTAAEAAAAWRALGALNATTVAPLYGPHSGTTPPQASPHGGHPAGPANLGMSAPQFPAQAGGAPGAYGPPPSGRPMVSGPPTSPPYGHPYASSSPSAPGFPLTAASMYTGAPGQPTSNPLSSSSPGLPQVPVAMQPAAPAGKKVPWLLVLAVALVLAATGVMVAVAYTVFVAR